MLNIVPSSGWRTAASNYHAVHLPVPPTDEERKAFSAPSLFALKHVAWAIRAVAFGLLLGMALPGLTADYADDFDDGAPEGWTAVIGTWTVDPDNAHSTANGPADIAVYSGESWATGFTYHLKVNNGLTSTSNLAGPVYNYQDSSNYYSVTFAPTGTAHLKKVINGTTTTVATAPYSGGGANVWFDVDVIRSGTSTTVKVNGVTIFSNIVQSELGAGKIGLITTWTDGRFDNVVLTESNAPFSENFDSGTTYGWTQSSGTWTVDTNNLHSTAIGPADIAVYSGGSWGTGFTYHVRVNNAYTSTSNLAGPVYNYQDTSNYYSVTFAPTGTAYLNKVINGTTTTVATASYSGGGPNVWFDVDVIRIGTSTTVKVNGVTIFSNIVQSELGAGKIGLITTWTDGRFDNVSLGVTIDTEAPSVPTGLTGTAVSPTQINLTWNASTDDFGVTGYTVFLNDAVLGTTTTATSFQHTGLTAGTTYNYRVSAHDAVPNHSAWTATPVLVTTTSSPSTPHTTAIAIPGTWEAENFDLGGEGVAYHDNVPGNAGGLYRSGEDVDIFVSNDPSGGAYIVKNFATGEWLNYTISVPANGNYDIELRVATDAGFPNRAYRLYVDGADVTGPVVLPDTGGWASYQWAGKKTVALTAGTHVLKITSEQQYFDMNQIRMTATGTETGPVAYSCDFSSSWQDCQLGEHAKVVGSRATLVTVGGVNAVRLHTESGDSFVNGSNTWERNDLTSSQATTDGYEGKEHWWAHSVRFPDDFVQPPQSVPGGQWHGSLVFDFHNTADAGGQANFQVAVYPATAGSPGWPTGMHLQLHAGDPTAPVTVDVAVQEGAITKNKWYNFTYHVRWADDSTGFFRAWVDGVQYMNHSGPTLYTGEGVYLKLANYHSPHGQPSSVIHARVIRSNTPL